MSIRIYGAKWWTRHAQLRRHQRTLLMPASGLSTAACNGPQSALDPAGPVANQLADLFWGMTAGAFVIFAAVVALALYAAYRTGSPLGENVGRFLIITGGVVFPSLVLMGLLIYGLLMLPGVLARAPEGSLTVRVVGEQWWWRVRYVRPEGAAVELANEIRLPVNQPVEFELTTQDVIHSFWIPPLGGKMDMIPGRTNRLTLVPSRTGTFRGVCAEYCGTSHALMAFPVVVEEASAFARWLHQQALAASEPSEADERAGKTLFMANGCGACHTIRGTLAGGVIGPDLTHVGGRLSLGAGILPNEASDFVHWIGRTDALKPGVHMPAFGMLSKEQLRSLGAYLESLR